MKSNVIAVDGMAYVGKSQIAKALSRLTGFAYINTGHMYRSLSKMAVELNVIPNDEARLLKLLNATSIEFVPSKLEWRTIVNGEDWTDLLDCPEIILFSSKIAALPNIRQVLTEIQRSYAQKQTIIMEGRDIGSVVFPDAKWKFFITASFDVRARRMLKIIPKDQNLMRSIPELTSKLKEIDEMDKNRKIAPLIKAPDALLYDNSLSPSAEEDAVILYYYVTNHVLPVKSGSFTYKTEIDKAQAYLSEIVKNK